MEVGTIILAISLIIIMFGMGLSLVKADFLRILERPKAIIIGLINQIILLPLIAYALIVLFKVDAAIAIGIMILAACPGGPTSNLITHLAKGDIGLSVSLTAVNSLVTVFTIPFIVDFALKHFLDAGQVIELDKLKTILQVFAIVIIPVTIGMWINNLKPNFAKKMQRPVKIASAAVLFAVIIVLVLKQKEDLIPYLKQAGVIALVLNVITMLLGYLSAKMLKLNLSQSITIAIESGIQNGTMALAIALGILMNESFAIAPAVYSLIMFLTGGLVIGLGLRFTQGNS